VFWRSSTAHLSLSRWALLIVEAVVASVAIGLPPDQKLLGVGIGALLFLVVIGVMIFLVVRYPENLVFRESTYIEKFKLLPQTTVESVRNVARDEGEGAEITVVEAPPADSTPKTAGAVRLKKSQNLLIPLLELMSYQPRVAGSACSWRKWQSKNFGRCSAQSGASCLSRNTYFTTVVRLLSMALFKGRSRIRM
jgi:hypothetical protein